MNPRLCFTGKSVALLPCFCNRRAYRTSVYFVVHALHQPFCFKAINQLSDVRLDAAQTGGKLSERKRLVGLNERMEHG